MKRASLDWLQGLLLALATLVLLPGCATRYLLDNEVQSFSHLPTLPANPTYRFERLPSQQAAPGQAGLEALADPALFKAGLRRDDTSARYGVQVSASVQNMVSPWVDPWGGGWGGWGFPHRRWGMGFGARMEPPWHHREVKVIVRELGAQKVVFESKAVSQGPWMDVNAVLPAMFEAAMNGFPNTPPGPRRVDILLGGQATAQAPTPAAGASAPAR
ncbi:MAG TPA: hypothetical protein VLJ58_18760 [Ramlibacter sp.]|nr:hypothetical protein [Ramlibacter sp.]